MVEFAGNQNKAVSEAIKRQAEMPVATATAIEMMQHAVDALLENQKEFLDVAAKLPKNNGRQSLSCDPWNHAPRCRKT